MKKVVMLALTVCGLSGCAGIEHSACPNAPQSNIPADAGVRSVIQTCN